MEQFLIYLWSITENFSEYLFNIGMVTIFAGSLICVLISICEEKEYPPVRNILKCIITGLILVFLNTLIPSKQDLALIFLYPHIKSGAEIVVKSETSKKMLDLVNIYLDTQLNELKSQKTKELK